jgi:ATP-dependent RNA helicase RhlE
MVRAIEKVLGKPLERRRLENFDYTVPAPRKDTEFARPPRQPAVRRSTPAAVPAAEPSRSGQNRRPRFKRNGARSGSAR